MKVTKFQHMIGRAKREMLIALENRGEIEELKKIALKYLSKCTNSFEETTVVECLAEVYKSWISKLNKRKKGA